MSVIIGGVTDFIRSLPIPLLILATIGILILLFVIVSYIWDAIKKRRLKNMKRDEEKDKERLLIEDLKIKQDIDNAKRVKGLEMENQDAELRRTSIDMNVKNAEEVTGASFKQTDKPALSSYMIMCDCGERIGRVFTGTPPSTIKCPKCGREHDVH